MYFNTPVWVLFYNAEEFAYMGGLAFEDYVVCGYGDIVIKLEEIMEHTPEGDAWLIICSD